MIPASGIFVLFLLVSLQWPSDDLLVCSDVEDDAYVELECFRELPKILYPPRVRCGRREGTHGRKLLLSFDEVTSIPSFKLFR